LRAAIARCIPGSGNFSTCRRGSQALDNAPQTLETNIDYIDTFL
jgi:hypothetical protein